MFSVFNKYKSLFLLFGDVLLTFIAIHTAIMARFGSSINITVFYQEKYHKLLPIIIILIFSTYLSEGYVISSNMKRRIMTTRIIISSVISFIAIVSLYYIVPDNLLGRGLLIIIILSFMLFQLVWHWLFFFSNSSPRFSQRVLVVGVSDIAHQIAEMIRDAPGGYLFIGYVQCGGETVAKGIRDDEVICLADSLRDAAVNKSADIVVIALNERRGVFPLRDALSCKLNGVEVLDAPSFYEVVAGKLMLEQVTPSWFIYSSGCNRLALIRFFKRSADIFMAIIGLLIAVLLFPFIFIAIKLDSSGPLFFSQLRVGNRERQFRLYKFRTMRQDAESDTGAIWAQENDTRVTRVGAILRKSRLDEIPQLFNVLLGQMSLIGPRPERPEFVDKLKVQVPYYSRRHFIKPGITGWAQVRYPYGASVDDAFEKLRYDLYYVKNMSVLLDTLIVFETIKVVLFGRGGR